MKIFLTGLTILLLTGCTGQTKRIVNEALEVRAKDARITNIETQVSRLAQSTSEAIRSLNSRVLELEKRPVARPGENDQNMQSPQTPQEQEKPQQE